MNKLDSDNLSNTLSVLRSVIVSYKTVEMYSNIRYILDNIYSSKVFNPNCIQSSDVCKTECQNIVNILK